MSARGPASDYVAITAAVDALARQHGDNDPDRVRYLIARAALLGMRRRREAAGRAYGLGDELAIGEVE